MSERRFDPAHMARLDNPERRKALPPDKILSSLNIQASDTVLDLGAGTGYFTLPAAKLTSGTVYALDAEPQMLNVLAERAKAEQLTNVELVQGEIERIPLDDGLADRIIASLVLHEVEPLSQGLKEIRRVLKPGGRCLCLEWEKKPMEQGPPLHHRISSEDLKQAFADCGFTVAATDFPTNAHYILVVHK